MKVPTEWVENLVQNLGEVDEASLAYLRSRRVKIGFRKQSVATAAIWTPGQRIYLNPQYFSPEQNPNDPRILGLIIHEICHLRQGFLTALSVYGELEAWQLGFRVEHGLTGQPYPPVIAELMALPLGWEREVLEQARQLMLTYARKGYRADLLPLYPLGKEIQYWIKSVARA